MRFKYFLLFLVFTIGFCSGTYFGYSTAPTEFAYWDSQFQASLAAHELESIASGNIENIKTFQEIKLNGALADHGRYLNSNLKWLLPVNHDVDTRAITHAVNYRINNPFKEADLSNPASWKPDADEKFISEVAKGQAENNRLREMVIEKYGQR